MSLVVLQKQVKTSMKAVFAEDIHKNKSAMEGIFLILQFLWTSTNPSNN